MLMLFISLSQVLITAGFSQALIQKKDPDEEDFSSVFYINLGTSVILYLLLFFCAPLIADFYNQPILTDLMRVLSVVFVINAFSYVQEARLTKEMKFKTLALIHVPSSIISGVISIVMANLGFGVWSIVFLQLSQRVSYAIQIWIYSKWKPLLSFNKKKARSLFKFGGRLMVSAIINSIYSNIYLVIIGKFFPVNTVGYYQNASNLVQYPTQTFSASLNSVTFPAFASVQDDDKKLKIGYKKVIQQLLYWICPAFVFSGVLAEPAFRLIFTEKWLNAVPYFQILCVVGILFPLNLFNLNIVNVKGRSDLFLKLEIIKKVVITVGIFISIPFGIWGLLIFQAINSVCAFFLNSYYSGKFIKYPFWEQVMDIFPVVLLSIIVGSLVFLTDKSLTHKADYIRIITGYVLGGGLYWLGSKIMKLAPYLDFLHLIKKKFVKPVVK